MWPCSPVPHGPVAQGGISDLWATNEQPGWLCVLLRPHLACRLPSAAEHPRLPSCPSVAGILAQPPALLSALPPPPQRWPLQRFPLHAPPVLGSSQKAGPHRLPLPLPGSLPCLGSTGMLTGSSIESPHLLQGLGECRWEAPSPGRTPPIKCTWSGSDPSRPHTPTSPLGVTEGVTHMVSGFPGCQLPAPASLV